jgi:hypothetical protein
MEMPSNVLYVQYMGFLEQAAKGGRTILLAATIGSLLAIRARHAEGHGRSRDKHRYLVAGLRSSRLYRSSSQTRSPGATRVVHGDAWSADLY